MQAEFDMSDQVKVVAVGVGWGNSVMTLEVWTDV